VDTDTDGRASAIWTLGPEEGTHTATATTDVGHSLSWTATAVTQLPACDVAESRCEDRLHVGGDLFVRYLRTFDLDYGHPTILRALVVVHGLSREHGFNFTTGILAATQAGALEETLIIAPYFQAEEDGPAPDELFWATGGWARGHLSSTSGPSPRVSSYEVMDRFMEALSDRVAFPMLEEIILAGHSAGGQYMHRYASGSPAEDGLDGVSVRYLVANPSTFLYLGPERPADDGFAIPDVEACPDYNHWHRGLESRNAYMNRVDDAQIIARLTSRDVWILKGTADTGDSDLDQSCGGNLQGAYRYERGLNIMRYMDTFFPGHRHTPRRVPDVAHSSRRMFTSSQGIEAIFGL
jgi:pimeloyl-ACP methyl ester carboxylesterase